MRGSSARFGRVVVLVVGLAILGIASAQPALARPVPGPCAPGASYDPACDADQDGDVDIFDIQLTAGHWNQSGTWVSDNNHDHLGQNWTGSDSLAIIGSFGSPRYAALVLDNNHPSGDGLAVAQAGGAGVSVYYSGWAGIFVGASGAGGGNGDGVRVCTAGSVGSCPIDTASNGVEIGHATGHGLRVMSADGDGLSVQAVDGSGASVQSAGAHGLFVGAAGGNGVYVGSAGAHGVYALTTNGAYNGVYGINSGGGNGVRGDSNGAITSGVYGENSGGGFGVAGRVLNGGRAVYGEAGAGWAGWFNGSVTITGTCTGCRQASFAVNTGTRALQPGDVVAVRGVTPADLDNAAALWDVLRAAGPGGGRRGRPRCPWLLRPSTCRRRTAGSFSPATERPRQANTSSSSTAGRCRCG
ncbi:MAG: hypothetical protein IPO15_24230 [Anaerolineae bacterium]|uniref:hypothetical protein n=1 Tax=Candidatus Amarolinea dominans TaxID=3140696 RepID=UPI003135D77F|nr:hypothetical protein [Anaerolineae bacterium]